MDKYALIVVTSNNKLGDEDIEGKTGWHLAEVSHVYWPLVANGFTVEFASPKGGKAPVSNDSFNLKDPENKNFIERFKMIDSLETQALDDIDSARYRIVYFAGGHGAMWDFPENKDIQRIASEIYEDGGIVSAICHGSSALVNVKLTDGSYLIAGKAINSFTDSEEREVHKDGVVPFLLESELRRRGANFEGAPNWNEKVVISHRLITGQNPQSASALGNALVRAYNFLEPQNESHPSV